MRLRLDRDIEDRCGELYFAVWTVRPGPPAMIICSATGPPGLGIFNVPDLPFVQR